MKTDNYATLLDKLRQDIRNYMETSKPTYRVIIAGSRTFADYELLKSRCDTILSGKSVTHNVIVISGVADGADRLGERYARERGLLLRQFVADWDKSGKAAGPIRNAKMAANADALIAFWDGTSKGTQNMIGQARHRHLDIQVINVASQRRAIRIH